MSRVQDLSFFPRVIRVAFAVMWCSSLYFDVTYQPRLGHEWYIYKLVMLTNLNFVIFTVYSTVCAFCSFSIAKFLDPVRNFMFFTSVFPIGMITCAMFWGLYSINPALVMPEWVAKLIPSWLNHVTHTVPAFQLLFELVCGSYEALAVRTNIVMSFLLVAIYFGIILVVRAVDGYWLYPLLELFQIEHFFIGYFVAVIGYFSLIILAQLISGKLYNPGRSGKNKNNKKLH